jgi:hypothetical protein
MGRRSFNKTAGRWGIFSAVLVQALVWTGCPDPTTEVEYRDLEVVYPVPYGIRIETAAQLAKIGLDPEFPAYGEYYLGNDIDLAGWKPEPSAEVPDPAPYRWKAIGSTCRECGGPLVPQGTGNNIRYLVCVNGECRLYETNQEPFSGTLHGNGKKISGLVLSGGTDEYQWPAYLGLFGSIQRAYIHDLAIEVANTAQDQVVSAGEGVDPSAYMYVGALAGFATNSRFDNISVSGNPGLWLTLSRTNNSVGGAVGSAEFSTLSRINAAITLNTQEKASEGAYIAHSVGGIVGVLSTGEISESTMNGSLEVQFVNAGTKSVSGLASGGTHKKNKAVLSTFKIDSKRENTNGTYISVGGLGGSATTILDCTAEFNTLELTVEDPTITMVYAGGLVGSTPTIANSHAKFEKITVKNKSTTGQGNIYVGGLAGGASNTIITSSYLEGGSIEVTGAGTDDPGFYVGGLAGQGSVSRSRIGYGININLETKSCVSVYAGGLTGNGNAEYSFIGAKDSHAAVNVKTDNSRTATVPGTYVGGISGQAEVSGKSFQYNYAFCDVSLENTGNGVVTAAVGGLAGYLSGAGAGNQSYAAGTVRLVNNSTAGTGTDYAGGIVGNASASYATNIAISSCAALNGEVSIAGTNTGAVKNWRRIANETTISTGTVTFTNNITTVDKNLPGYTPDNGANTADGDFKESIVETDFRENGLDWDFEKVWEWKDGYPVLQAQVFQDEA